MAVKIEKKAPMVLGMGAVLAGVILLAWPKKPALPEPPPNGVVVGLWDPPEGAENWALTLTDWNITVAIHLVGGLAQLDVTEPAIFEIPSGAQFPLRIVSLQVSRWIEWQGAPALEHLYYVQSFRPFLFDFDIMDWSDEPDPSYKEVFIPDYGSYYYNVAKGRFG